MSALAPPATTASHPHLLAVGLPEPAHGGFAHAAFLRRGAAAAHLDHRLLAVRAADAALHEARGGAVLHRDVAGRADEIGLAQAQLRHRVVVVDIAEAGPHQLGALEALRHHA